MEKFRYCVIRSELKIEELCLSSYGLKLIDRRGKTVEEIPDISSDEAFVRQLALSFTEGKLAPVHFRDAVEDALP